jgi:hypothetical protein
MFLLQQNKIVFGELIQKYSDSQTDDDKQKIMETWNNLNAMLGANRNNHTHSVISTFIDP